MYQIVDHPLIKQKLTVLRNKDTATREFRQHASEVTMLIAYEALKSVELEECPIETPLAPFAGTKLKNDIVIVPILRAGVGMLEAFLSLVPNAKVGFIGMYRDAETKQPVTYYEKLPENLRHPLYYIVDPMLATGGSLVAAIDLLKDEGAKYISVLSILAAPEGIAAVESKHPDVPMFCGALDEKLDERKYIVPGLGDAGDRLYGTK